MTDKQCRSRTTHHVLTQWKIHRRAKKKLTTHWQRRQSRLLLIWSKISGPSAFKLSHFKRNSNNNYSFVALQYVVTDHCIASFQTREPIVFSYLLKARNEHHKVFYFNRGTHHFSSLSPPKLIYSSVWFVVKARRRQLRLYWPCVFPYFPSQQYNVKPIKNILKST